MGCVEDLLKYLDKLQIPRTITKISPPEALHKEIDIICESSAKAIAAVANLNLSDSNRSYQIGFVKVKT